MRGSSAVYFAGQAGVDGVDEAAGTSTVSKCNGKMRGPRTSMMSSLASSESREEEKMVLEKRDNGERRAASQYGVYTL